MCLTSLKWSILFKPGNGWDMSLIHKRTKCKLKTLRQGLFIILENYRDTGAEDIDNEEEIFLTCEDVDKAEKHNYPLNKDYLRKSIQKQAQNENPPKKTSIKSSSNKMDESKSGTNSKQKNDKRNIANANKKIFTEKSYSNDQENFLSEIDKKENIILNRKVSDLKSNKQTSIPNKKEMLNKSNSTKNELIKESYDIEGQKADKLEINENKNAKKEIPKKKINKNIAVSSDLDVSKQTSKTQTKASQTRSIKKERNDSSSNQISDKVVGKVLSNEKLKFSSIENGRFKLFYPLKTEYSNAIHTVSTMSIEVSLNLIFNMLNFISGLMKDIVDLENKWKWGENKKFVNHFDSSEMQHSEKNQHEKKNLQVENNKNNSDLSQQVNENVDENDIERAEYVHNIIEKIVDSDNKEIDQQTKQNVSTNIARQGNQMIFEMEDDDLENAESESNYDSDSSEFFELTNRIQPLKFEIPKNNDDFKVISKEKVPLSNYSKNKNKMSGDDELTSIIEVECELNTTKDKILSSVNYIYFFRFNKCILQLINNLRKEKNLEQYEWLDFEEERIFDIKYISMFSAFKSNLKSILGHIEKDQRDYMNGSQQKLFVQYYLEMIDLFEEALDLNYLDNNIDVWSEINRIFKKITEKFNNFHQLKMKVFKEETAIREKKQNDVINSFLSVIKEIAYRICDFDRENSNNNLTNNQNRTKNNELSNWVENKLGEVFIELTNDLNSLTTLKRRDVKWMTREFSLIFSELLSKKKTIDNEQIGEIFKQTIENTKQKLNSGENGEFCHPHLKDSILFWWFEGTRNLMNEIKENTSNLIKKKKEDEMLPRLFGERNINDREYLKNKKEKLKRKFQELENELNLKTTQKLKMIELENENKKQKTKFELHHFKTLYEDISKNHDLSKMENERLAKENETYQKKIEWYERELLDKEKYKNVLDRLLNDLSNSEKNINKIGYRQNNILQQQPHQINRNDIFYEVNNVRNMLNKDSSKHSMEHPNINGIFKSSINKSPSYETSFETNREKQFLEKERQKKHNSKENLKHLIYNDQPTILSNSMNNTSNIEKKKIMKPSNNKRNNNNFNNNRRDKQEYDNDEGNKRDVHSNNFEPEIKTTTSTNINNNSQKKNENDAKILIPTLIEERFINEINNNNNSKETEHKNSHVDVELDNFNNFSTNNFAFNDYEKNFQNNDNESFFNYSNIRINKDDLEFDSYLEYNIL